MNQFGLLKSSRLSYQLTLLGLIAMIALGLFSAHRMDSEGHWITGMNNQIVWGIPHVFAIFLILAASGALNIASVSSVFGREVYSQWARVSGLLAICFLMGGLTILVFDLGRPERLIVAMTYYNFKSVFAWNIFLYVGLILIVIAYLWTMFERGMGGYTRKVGVLALVWRFVLTGGTGSIFGFLVAREFYDSAMMIPVFIVLSLVLGTALSILTIIMTTFWSGKGVEQAFINRLSSLLSVFVALQLFLILGFHLAGLYAAEHRDIEYFILFGGGVYSLLFWGGQIVIGAFLPLLLNFSRGFGETVKGAIVTSGLVIIGGICQLYVTVIGGQAYPLNLFPGKEVSSTFYDGVVAEYMPSLFECMLGLAGVALSVFLIIVVMRILPFLPQAQSVRVSQDAG